MERRRAGLIVSSPGQPQISTATRTLAPTTIGGNCCRRLSIAAFRWRAVRWRRRLVVRWMQVPRPPTGRFQLSMRGLTQAGSQRRRPPCIDVDDPGQLQPRDPRRRPARRRRPYAAKPLSVSAPPGRLTDPPSFISPNGESRERKAQADQPRRPEGQFPSAVSATSAPSLPAKR